MHGRPRRGEARQQVRTHVQQANLGSGHVHAAAHAKQIHSSTPNKITAALDATVQQLLRVYVCQL